MLKRAPLALAMLCIGGMGMLTLGAPAALAAGLACGTTITTNTVLTADVTGCSGVGIIIGADGITLDLKGHTVSGTGADPSNGILVAFHHDVVITNGTVSGFWYGVVADTSTGVTVSKITALDNIRGINFSNTSASLITKSVASSSGLDGIRLDGYGTHDNRVTQSQANGNVWGITISNGAHDNLVDRNTVTDNQFGLPLFSGTTSNTILRNSVSGNVSYGILVTTSAETAVVQNSIYGNGTDGVVVDGSASDTTLLQNDASYNGADGFRVGSASTTITKNTATYNVALGIEAVDGVTDGGGNVAYGNGDSAQCAWVTCTTL